MGEKRAAIYARVSTRKWKERNGKMVYQQDPETQLKPCREYCERMEWDFQEYFDRESGSKTDRKQLNQLMEDARLRKFDVLVFYKLDRLARSVKQLIDLFDFLGSKNIDIVSIKDPIDTTTPSGKLIFHIMAAISEFERELTRQRVIDGIDRAREEGKHIGRKPVKLNVEIAREMKKQGYSYEEISEKLGVSKATVYFKLNPDKYQGYMEK